MTTAMPNKGAPKMERIGKARPNGVSLAKLIDNVNYGTFLEE